jgi:uncharacterized iron-regulated protein
MLLRGCVMSLLLSALGACSHQPSTQRVDELPLSQPLLLFGEVHDNAIQHAERLRAFQALLARGARPALAMEQLDRDRQGAIDALLRRTPAPGVDEIIAAGAPAGPGWDWAFYRPFLMLAMQYGLPIVAANVSRDDARQVMRDGLAATGFDPAVPADLLAAHGRDIVASHCGMVDAPTAQRMALAQVARDQFMARALQAHAARGVVLLAGNGHVRNDLGAPRWLPAALRASSQTVGWLEEGADPAERSAFDSVRITPVQVRPDPCAGMRKQIPAKPTPETAR